MQSLGASRGCGLSLTAAICCGFWIAHPVGSIAQPVCNTTAECAQIAMGIALRLEKTLKEIRDQLDTSIVFNQRETDSSSGARAQKAFSVGPFPRDALLNIDATGRGSYKTPSAGVPASAGVHLEIVIDGNPVAGDFSIDAEAYWSNFAAAASYSMVLKKGEKREVRAIVQPGHNNMTDIKVTLGVIGIAVGP